MASDGNSINLRPVQPSDGRRREPSPRRVRRDVEAADQDAEPFFESGVPNVPAAAPRANPENEFDDRMDDTNPQPGVDDSFYPDEPRKTRPDDVNDNKNMNGQVPRRRNNNGPSRPFPREEDFAPTFITVDGVVQEVPDVNVYQHKKTLAQGMMDLALLTANANQLRYVLESYGRHPYYYVSVTFITLSLIFQVAVGIGLILNSRYNVKSQKEICKANKINNYTIIGIFLITIINVFVSAFGVADPPADMNA